MNARMSERGSALILAIVVTLLVAGMSGTYLTLAVSKKDATFKEVEREKAFYAAEAALAQAKLELSTNRDYDTTGLGNVTVNTIANTQVSVTVDLTGLTGNLRRLTAIGTFGPNNKRIDRSIEEVVDKPVRQINLTGYPPIVADGNIDFTGNISVDGRDWNMAGSAIVAGGGDGVWAGGALNVGGSAGIGGNGLPPPNGGAAPGSIEPNHNWAADSLDNDNDGTVDQVGEGFPSDPDQAIGTPAGSLLATAKASGTYFNNQASYMAAIAANGGQMPGGKVIYCDFTPSPPFELGTTMNAAPSILIIHNATSTAVAQNVHGSFKGLLMADKIEHINAGTDILGMVYAWGQFGNTFGNGTSSIRFSSEVMANLPRPQITPTYIRKSYREVVR